ncbi:MAG: GntR family transcriptional regulator [Bacillota bacterium]
MPVEDTTPLVRADLDTLVYERVRQMILDGALPPGEQIIQDQLARRLGVSRTPLRRALTQLAKDNLVEMTPRGTFVRQFTLDEVIAVFEIRGVLEGLACRLFAERAEPPDIAYMRSLFTTAMERITPDHWSAYRQADQEFHYYIAKKSNSSIISQTLSSFHILTISFLQGLIRPPEETFPEHMRIIDALEERDPDKAERYAVEHIRITVQLLKEGRMAGALSRFGIRSPSPGGRSAASTSAP